MDYLVGRSEVHVVGNSALFVVDNLDIVRNDHGTIHIHTTAVHRIADHVFDNLSVLVHHQGAAIIDTHGTAVASVIVVLLQHRTYAKLHRSAISDVDQRCGSGHGRERTIDWLIVLINTGLDLVGTTIVVAIKGDTHEFHSIAHVEKDTSVGLVVFVINDHGIGG